jgi:uncharacterized protein DUF6184
MKTSTTLAMCALFAGMVSQVGCSKAHEPEPLTAHDANTPLAGSLTPAAGTRTAAEQIAQSRCEREQQCGNIGKDQTYSSSQDCLARIRNDWKEELNARECPGGINQKELNECLQHVRGEACSNPFDALARVTECTSGQICIVQP